MTNPAERQRGHSSPILPIATLLVSLAATYFAYKSADYAEESAKAAAASAETAEQIRIQDVESRQFAARADSSWTITIEQVAGPHYLLKTIHLSPEYQVSDGETKGQRNHNTLRAVSRSLLTNSSLRYP